MYTNILKRNRLSSLMVTVIFTLVLIMPINMQNVYAEIDILGNTTGIENIQMQTDEEIIETSLEETVDTVNGIVTKAEQERRQKELIEQQMLEQKRREELRRMKTVESSRNVQYYEINVYTDLSVMTTITTDQMNTIIDYWNSRCGGDSPFVGQGQVFIDAAKQSGLDPVYILAHAGLESAWGTSYLAETHHNYFGIGAYDTNPSYASNYANSDLAIGIIEGANWIADNFYDNGQTSLYTMRYSSSGTHNYCSSETWAYSISDIMCTSYSLIQ